MQRGMERGKAERELRTEPGQRAQSPLARAEGRQEGSGAAIWPGSVRRSGGAWCAPPTSPTGRTPRGYLLNCSPSFTFHPA